MQSDASEISDDSPSSCALPIGRPAATSTQMSFPIVRMHYMCLMCNRIRGLQEWSEIPRALTRLPLVNFDYNPNVAPTEHVPAFLADCDKPLTCKLARFRYQSPRSVRQEVPSAPECAHRYAAARLVRARVVSMRLRRMFRNLSFCESNLAWVYGGREFFDLGNPAKFKAYRASLELTSRTRQDAARRGSHTQMVQARCLARCLFELFPAVRQGISLPNIAVHWLER